MDNNDLVSKLKNVVQIDIDAVFAYQQALNNIDDEEIYTRIDEFRQDHENHIISLNKLIINYGGEPVERTKDFTGFVISGFTSLRSITGTIGALKAMKSNEELTNKTYREALENNNMPKDIRECLEKNYSDEVRHLQYIQEQLQADKM